MTRRGFLRQPRGYFGIGIWHGKTEHNLGTLWRSADVLGASFLFTVGRRYRPQSSDTRKSWRHVPLWQFDDFGQLRDALPRECQLVAVELGERATPLPRFRHPERAVYVLGAEDHGLSGEVLDRCHAVVQLPGTQCLNVAAAGSVVLYDRVSKLGQGAA